MKRTSLMLAMFILGGFLFQVFWYGCGGDRLLNARTSFYNLEGYKITQNRFSDEQITHVDVKTWNKFLNHLILKFDEFEKWIWDRGRIQAGTVTMTDSEYVATASDYYGVITITLKRPYSNTDYQVFANMMTDDTDTYRYTASFGIEILSRSQFRIWYPYEDYLPRPISWMTIGIKTQ